jgi:hypothetical protein
MPQIHKNFEVHDSFQFEMKLDYWLKLNKRDDYQVDLFLFLPNALGLNHRSYSHDAFYDDIKNYVRLKTPGLNLKQVVSLDEGRPGGLLSNCVTAFQTSAPTEDSCRKVEYHAKMYVSITVRALHNGCSSCLTDLAQGSTQSTEELIVEINSVLELIRTLSREIPAQCHSRETDRLPTVMSSADEYLTSEINQVFLTLLAVVEPGENPLRTNLLHCIEQLSSHSAQQGFPQLDSETSGHDETVLFRHSIFKKFFRSPLFLTQHRQTEGRLASQVAMGIAAGLSMVFATLIAFLAQQRFGNFTLPLFVALVVGYVFKDRIKELTKIYLEKWLSRRVSDSKTSFFDNDGRRMGVCREMVRFLNPDQVPREILALRNKDHLTEIANFWQSEKIIQYRKNVSLFRKPLQRANPGYETTAVNDIIRYNVRRLLWNMDEPEKELLALQKDGSVGPVTGARVYKINLLLRLSGGADEQFLRFRLILDRDGIRRMEKV